MNKTELTEIDLNHYNSIKDIIIDEEDIKKIRYVEIYKITCKITNKSYVGQTVSHVLNHKRYRPYGAIKRFNAHVSEAGSTKKCQCKYLNEDIVQYGSENFSVEVILVSDEKDGNKIERQMIESHNTLHPNGYNYSEGSNVKCRDKKSAIEKYKNVGFLIKPNEKYLIIKSQDGEQIGWRVRIEGIDTGFTSIKYSLEEKKQMAIEFIQKIRDAY